MNRILAVSMCIAALAGCGGDSPAPTTAPPPAPTPTPPAPPPPPPPEPPAAPSGLRVAASGTDFIEWTWNAVEGADGYDVQLSATEAFTDEDEIIARTAEQSSYRREGLEAGTTAYLRVRSASGTGEERITSDWSTYVAGMTEAPTPPPEPPATPTGLEVSDSGSDFIEWSWDPVPGALGYVVQVSTDETFDDAILGNAETVLFDGLPFTAETSYTAGDLEAGTTLYLRVAAAAGTPTAPLVSAFTIPVTGVTVAAAPPPPEPPATPTGLEVSDSGSDFIEWSWDPVDGALGYVVQASTDETFDDAIVGNPETVLFDGLPFTAETSYTAGDLEAGTTLYLRVAAAAGTPTAPLVSAFTIPVTGVTVAAAPPPPEAPATPTDFRVSAETADSITWTWNAVADAQGYLVQISTDETFEDMFEGDDEYAVRLGASNTSYTATDLEPGTTLHVRVAAGVLKAAVPSLNPEDYLLSAWTTPATGMTAASTATTAHVTGFVRGGNLAGRRGHQARSLLHEPGGRVPLAPRGAPRSP